MTKIGLYDYTNTDWVVLGDFDWATETLTVIASPSGESVSFGVEKLKAVGPNGGKVMRVWVTAKPVAGSVGNIRRVYIYPRGSATDLTACIIHAAQLELGDTPSSYIPTTTVAVTRQPDGLAVRGRRFLEMFNHEAVAIVARVVPGYSTTATRGLYSLSIGSTDNQIDARIQSGNYRALMAYNAVTQASVDSGVVETERAEQGIAASYQQDAVRISVDGSAAVEDTSATMSVGIAQIEIGKLARSGGFEYYFDGHIKSMTLYTAAKTAAELQELSS